MGSPSGRGGVLDSGEGTLARGGGGGGGGGGTGIGKEATLCVLNREGSLTMGKFA